MKVLLINEVCGHTSTGKICAEIADKYAAEGCEVKIAYGRNSFVPEKYQKYAARIGGDLDVRLHAVRTRIFDEHGFGSVKATKRFLKWAEEYSPDLLWLHNLHGYYINIELLFNWIKKHPTMEVKWTLHDCWAFTGHCSHFTVVKCEQWKDHCLHCCQKNRYPKSVLRDNCYINYDRKRRAFTGVKNLTIVVPSNWLANLVKQSYLREYLIEVVYNTINTEIFKPTPSDFRKKYNIQDKRMLLGVANVWDDRKGLNDFIDLSKLLDDQYVIVLVGVSRHQARRLPPNIIGVQRTANQQELAGIYTTADLFINPSREETFGLTTIEAKACGTDVIVIAGTACEEIAVKYGGIVIPGNNIKELYNAVTGFSYQLK